VPDFPPDHNHKQYQRQQNGPDADEQHISHILLGLTGIRNALPVVNDLPGKGIHGQFPIQIASLRFLKGVPVEFPNLLFLVSGQIAVLQLAVKIAIIVLSFVD